ncbi:pyrimidine dimer DNA glycosylase/endonuclease V [Microbacterium sp. 179-I 3D3 NHS]|uniref:pyrimidine dimer DNA glycosylase/endonuclease V n=1 Tax=Microbacterium sp. 179-I 3D3 NHS TaxID=3142382 RepID=UPI0039A24C86
MRIWSLHPEYLDRQGLIACWRETLLAQAVLAGRTRGYLGHPQLERFRAVPEPLSSVAAYLSSLADEADTRGYRFDRSRIERPVTEDPVLIPVTTGQLMREWEHLRAKLTSRSPEVAARWKAVDVPRPHPIFTEVPGAVASWEHALPSA